MSVPLGAGRLTREFFDEQPPSPKQTKRLRRYVREQIEPVAQRLLAFGEPNMVVGTSKTFRSLARICGAAPYSAGPHVKREMHVTDLRLWTRRMEAMAPAERADLPGVPGCAPTRFSRAQWRLRPRWKPSVSKRCVFPLGLCAKV